MYILIRFIKKNKRQKISSQTYSINQTPYQDTKIGRPIGSTNEKKRQNAETIKIVKHKILCKCIHEFEKQSHSSKYFKKKIFKNILEDETIANGLTGVLNFPYKTAISRIRRSSLNADGKTCPVYQVEKKLYR